MLVLPEVQTTNYAEHSLKSRSTNAWNLKQKKIENRFNNLRLFQVQKTNFSLPFKSVPAMSLVIR